MIQNVVSFSDSHQFMAITLLNSHYLLLYQILKQCEQDQPHNSTSSPRKL